MDAAGHTHLESLVFAAGMTAYAEDCDILIRRAEALPARVPPTLLYDADFPPPAFGD